MWGRDKAESHQNYDDYETDGDDQEEEMAESAKEEEPEDPKPTKDELDYLKTREKLKERIRQKYKKENASAFGHSIHSRDKNGTTTNAKFGSFFGPSQPVIAARVIEESRSIRETQHIAARTPNSSSAKKRVSTTAEMKTHACDKPQKVVNELKIKVQTLKDVRDYSFLLSDDAELPAPAKEPAPRNVSVPNSDARSARAQPKTMVSTSKAARPGSGGHEMMNALSRNQHMQAKVGNQKAVPLSRPKPSLADPRKSFGGNVGNGPGRPTVPRASSHAPAKSEVTKRTPAMAAKKYVSSLERRPSSTMPHSSTQNQYSEQRREPQGVVGKAKITPKQPVSSSKPQMSMPSKQIQQRRMHEDPPRKKHVRKYSDEEDDGAEAINMIRQMFRYNPNKYAGVDDDDSDMEANFDDIIEEEERSLRIARREDEEQLRLIEEEERRERMRKEAKKRKLMTR